MNTCHQTIIIANCANIAKIQNAIIQQFISPVVVEALVVSVQNDRTVLYHGEIDRGGFTRLHIMRKLIDRSILHPLAIAVVYPFSATIDKAFGDDIRIFGL